MKTIEPNPEPAKGISPSLRAAMSGLSALLVVAFTLTTALGAAERMSFGPGQRPTSAGLRYVAQALIQRTDRVVQRQTVRPVAIQESRGLAADNPDHAIGSIEPAQCVAVARLSALLTDLPPPTA